MVLLLDRISDVDKLSVFEKQEVVLDRELLQAFNSVRAEIRDEVDVCFEDCDIRAELCLRG